MAYSDPTREFFEACNRTELYQLCARVGLVTSPAAPRDKLVSYLLGEEVPPPMEHPVHVWRNGLIGLIQDYWTGIEAQLRCPAKELGPPAKEGDPPKPDPSDYKSPIACYRCVDTRVMSCLVENASHEGLIQLHRKMTVRSNGEDDMSMTIGSLTLETAPRSMEGMSQGNGLDRGTLKRLYDRLVNDGALSNDPQAAVAFVDGSLEARRQVVIDGLKVWDQMKARAGGQGAVVSAGAAPGAPAPTPVVSGTPTPTGGEPPRTPSNRGRRTATPAQGASPGSEEAQAPIGEPNIGEAIVGSLTGIKLMLESAVTQLGKLQDARNEDAQASVSQHAQLLGAIQSLEKTVKTAAAIALWQVDQGGQDSPTDVMKQVGLYIAVFEKGVAALGKGA